MSGFLAMRLGEWTRCPLWTELRARGQAIVRVVKKTALVSSAALARGETAAAPASNGTSNLPASA